LFSATMASVARSPEISATAPSPTRTAHPSLGALALIGLFILRAWAISTQTYFMG